MPECNTQHWVADQAVGQSIDADCRVEEVICAYRAIRSEPSDARGLLVRFAVRRVARVWVRRKDVPADDQLVRLVQPKSDPKLFLFSKANPEPG